MFPQVLSRGLMQHGGEAAHASVVVFRGGLGLVDQEEAGLLLRLPEFPLLGDHHIDQVDRLGREDLVYVGAVLDTHPLEGGERGILEGLAVLGRGEVSDLGQLLLVAELLNQVPYDIRVFLGGLGSVLECVLDQSDDLAHVVLVINQALVGAVSFVAQLGVPPLEILAPSHYPTQRRQILIRCFQLSVVIVKRTIFREPVKCLR